MNTIDKIINSTRKSIFYIHMHSQRIILSNLIKKGYVYLKKSRILEKRTTLCCIYNDKRTTVANLLSALIDNNKNIDLDLYTHITRK